MKRGLPLSRMSTIWLAKLSCWALFKMKVWSKYRISKVDVSL